MALRSSTIVLHTREHLLEQFHLTDRACHFHVGTCVVVMHSRLDLVCIDGVNALDTIQENERAACLPGHKGEVVPAATGQQVHSSS